MSLFFRIFVALLHRTRIFSQWCFIVDIS